jgi:hypothetical protein
MGLLFESWSGFFSTGVRAAFSVSSAILADLDIRGFAISFRTLATVARPDFS